MVAVAAGARNAEIGASRIDANGVLDVPSHEDLFAALRDLVEGGEPDRPLVVTRDGHTSVRVGSLHAACLLTVAETPAVRFIHWRPHPYAVVGPRIAALLAKRDAAIAARKAAKARKKDTAQ